ncbi:Large proline-rich protein bag6 [Papilio machaon]|uniref:BCL2-associated athanogene 6 n=1 Tax=Papilio machaon TaxID=76193 RepID=A0A194QWC0_PAPMA|nr:Large proline-rich protein bag6 [Papilio machaon]
MIDFQRNGEHYFELDNQTTVEELKIIIQEEMDIDVGSQRLIFCGRVLQDDKKLTEYGVHGKVIHMVQRPPPAAESRRFRDDDDDDTGNQGVRFHSAGDHTAHTRQEIRRLMESMNLSPTMSRMEFVRRVISEIRITLLQLRNHVAGRHILTNEEEQPGPSTSSGRSGGRANPALNEDDIEAIGAFEHIPSSLLGDTPHFQRHADDIVGVVTRADNFNYGPRHGLQPSGPYPRDLANLMEELEVLNLRFARYRAMYMDLLMVSNRTVPPVYSEAEKATQRRTIELTCAIMHSFSHAYHAISDITLDLSPRIPQLTSEMATMHATMPVHAVINVVQSPRTNNQAGWAPQGGPPGTGAAQPTAAPGTGNSDFENIFRGLGHQNSVEVVMSMEEIPAEAVAAGHIISAPINQIPIQGDGQGTKDTFNTNGNIFNTI